MTGIVLLDSAPLGYLCNPRNRDMSSKFYSFLKEMKLALRLPEIVDYELRRNFELEDFIKSISLLNQFRRRDQLLYLESDNLVRAHR
jgi:hypothetical protein